MKTIWKWTLKPETTIDVPQGAKLLAVQEQHGEPQLWAMVDTSAKKIQRTFRVHGTGHDLPDDPGEYVGTFQIRNGALVFHVFEVNGALTAGSARSAEGVEGVVKNQVCYMCEGEKRIRANYTDKSGVYFFRKLPCPICCNATDDQVSDKANPVNPVVDGGAS